MLTHYLCHEYYSRAHSALSPIPRYVHTMKNVQFNGQRFQYQLEKINNILFAMVIPQRRNHMHQTSLIVIHSILLTFLIACVSRIL